MPDTIGWGGGDVHRESGPGVGLLGANFVVDNNRWQVARVYTGESWNPFATGPLSRPGSQVQAGEYILAINGREISADDNLFAHLHDTVDKQVRLRVGPRADGRDSREVIVEPVGSESELRLWGWIEDNRRAVDEATDGRIGYIYLPNTAGAGYTFFNRMFHAQIDREGLIIDERSNGGGQAANYIVEVLSRRHLSSWVYRDAMMSVTPMGAVHGPKLMMIDQDAGSGGDYLPYAFRELEIGPLLGTRTWGGLIGIFRNPPLIDGGTMTVPHFRFGRCRQQLDRGKRRRGPGHRSPPRPGRHQPGPRQPARSRHRRDPPDAGKLHRRHPARTTPPARTTRQ